MSPGLRVMLSGGFSEGHAYPTMALATALRDRGHTVLVELSERWREPVAAAGMEFTPTADYAAFPSAGPAEPGRATVIDRVGELGRLFGEFRPELVIADLVAPAPALAAELAGTPLATLIPVLYPVQGSGLPPYEEGFVAPRTALGGPAWRIMEPALRPFRASARWLGRVPALVDENRRALGLAPLPADRPLTTYGQISDGLALVATFPQLEYPRRWPDHVHVTGPMEFELPAPDIELPPGNEPLVVVAGSTVHDTGDLLSTALGALAGEPVRVVASLNRRGARWTEPVPANAIVVDWASYAQLLPLASLVITSGGHGTVARALGAGVPVLVCPAGADAAENGARVTWAGAGLMLPRRLLAGRALRLAAQRTLSEPRFARRAAELGRWAAEHDGARMGAELAEAYAAGSG